MSNNHIAKFDCFDEFFSLVNKDETARKFKRRALNDPTVGVGCHYLSFYYFPCLVYGHHYSSFIAPLNRTTRQLDAIQTAE